MKTIILSSILVILLLPISASALADQDYKITMMTIFKEQDPSKRLVLIKDFLKVADSDIRSSILTKAAKTAFEAKEYSDAKSYANELLNTADSVKKGWNYGNAIHDGNMILGRLAIVGGDITLAKKYLIKAGNTLGSPQLNSFGPNMSLAKYLTDIGENDAVIQYFNLCKKFWKMENGRLDSWSASLRGGGKPYYGTNLLY
ncbi:MAG: hypothetical protein COA83_01270 [Methylophaga sp.]|nr:MAG: hypothetical protein COA83_01270 [Methylophaga sp.]